MLDSEADLTYLAALYQDAKVPYKAAAVLERGIRAGIVQPSPLHWTHVGDAWYAADELEKSLAAYREAGNVADDGLADLRRGYILVGLERWPDALDALNQALGKGGLDDHQTGEAYLMRGMARFNLGDADGAGADWARAGDHDASRKAARQWMNQLREEQERPGRPMAG
jgi:tetratricopeptide (TPR) repeat protein